MAWKPITDAGYTAFKGCIAKEHDGHTLSANDQKIVTDCFTGAFAEEAPIPPPLPATCKDGYVAGTDTWQGWCLQYRDRFRSAAGGVMIMESNAKSAIRHPEWQRPRGAMSIEVNFRTANIPQGGGGKHLIEIPSAHKAMGSPIGSGGFYKNWFRPDLQPVNGELRIHTYSADENGAAWYQRGSGKDYVCDVWDTNLRIPGVGQWFTVMFQWERVGPKEMAYRLKVNEQEARRGFGDGIPVGIHERNENPGITVLGNMDGLSNFGGTPEIWFRNHRVID